MVTGATFAGAMRPARGGARGPAVAVSVLLHSCLLALCTWTVVTQPREQPPIRVTLLGARDAGGGKPMVNAAPAPSADMPPSPPPPAPMPMPPRLRAVPKKAVAAVRRPAPRKLVRVAPSAPAVPGAAAAPVVPASPQQQAGNGGGSGGGSGGGAGAGTGPGVAGDPGGDALAGYLGRLRGRLEAVKRYPTLARRRGSTGTAMLFIVIDRNGRPTGVTLQRSSGSELLDEEATEMVSRAAPFDPLPAELAGDTLQITVPVRFDVSG
jgi:protein TonB